MELPAPDRWDQINSLLAAAEARPAEDRAAFLDSACDDETVRETVESLLDAATSYSPLFDRGAAAMAHPLFAPDEAPDAGPTPLAPSQRVGPYRLDRRIGAGGTSTVYRAERADDEFERTVAIKVLRGVLGRDDDTVERFRAERQILASLSHPHLADVYDGGVLPDGRPYLVMEYVDGRPLTEHCRAEDCSLEERLALFRQAATAVQAAHEQLVVHRDLKPSNVMVERDTGQVKLLDFGIAKILGDLPGGAAPTTQTGRQPMTPAYAAPEQVKGEPISVATDTYALGVLLYELLTDTRPYGSDDQSPYAVARAVCETDPPAPSVAAEDPARRRDLDGDLDAIVMRALRKAPADRYSTVDDLISDLQHFHDEQPVRAQRGGVGYRTRKFVRRNQRVLATAAVALGLLASFVAYHVQRLSEERADARQEAETAEQVADYLSTVFQAGTPSEAQGQTVTAADLLDQGRRRIDRLDDEPAVQAELLGVLGRAYRSLDQLDAAQSLLERRYTLVDSMHSANHPAVAAALADLGILHRKREDLARADSLHRRALSIRRDHLGLPHPKTAQSFNDLAVVQELRGEYDIADSLYRKALSLREKLHGRDDPRTATVLDNRASTLKRQGNLERAEALQREAAQILASHIEAPHPDLHRSLHDLAGILEDQGETAAADSLYRRALTVNETIYDRPNESRAQTLNNLGVLHGRQGHVERADSFLTRALRIRRQVLAETHPRRAESLSNLARLRIETGAYEKALPLLKEALALDTTNYGPGHPNAAATLLNLGLAAGKQGAVEEAIARYRRALSIYEEALPDGHWRTGVPLFHWGRLLMNEDRPAEARPKLDRARRIFEEALPAPHDQVRRAQRLHADCLSALGEYRAAESILVSAYETLVESEDPTHPQATALRGRLVDLYEAWGRPEKAADYRTADGS